MILQFPLDLGRETWGILFVFSVAMAVQGAIFTYAVARKAEREDPGKWALGVAISFVGTAIVGFPVFLLVVLYLATKIDLKAIQRTRKET